MNNDAVRVSRIEFRAAMPSLLLLEAVRLAFSVQCLFPAALGILLFAGTARLVGESSQSETEADLVAPSAVPVLFHCIQTEARMIAVRGLSGGWMPLVRLSMCMMITGLTGVAVSRASGLRICADRRTGAVRSIRHALVWTRSIVVSCILTGLLCGIALTIFRVLLFLTTLAAGADAPHSLWRVPGWSGAVLVIAVAAVCGMGWLLSLSAMGVDGCDGPESLSRGISYVLSRFRRTFCCAAAISGMTWLLSAGCSYLLLQAAILSSQSLGYSSEGLESTASGFTQFRWFIVESWKLSVVFSGVTLSYLLLRQTVDGVELQEASG